MAHSNRSCKTCIHFQETFHYMFDDRCARSGRTRDEERRSSFFERLFELRLFSTCGKSGQYWGW